MQPRRRFRLTLGLIIGSLGGYIAGVATSHDLATLMRGGAKEVASDAARQAGRQFAQDVTWLRTLRCHDAPTQRAAEVSRYRVNLYGTRGVRLVFANKDGTERTIVYRPTGMRQKTADLVKTVEGHAAAFCKTGAQPPEPV